MPTIEDQIGRVADGLFALRDSFDRFTAIAFSKRPSKPTNAGTSRNISERKENDMFVEDFVENFPDLPPAVGNDADIQGGTWTATIDGQLIASTDVEYDLDTRKATTTDFAWSAPKGASVVKTLYFFDDETPPNHGKVATETLVSADTVGPDAPTGAGTSQNVGERTVPDA